MTVAEFKQKRDRADDPEATFGLQDRHQVAPPGVAFE